MNNLSENEDQAAIIDSLKQLAAALEAELTREDLCKYIEEFQAPYNSVEFARLELEEKDEFLDPITSNVMNLPVILNNLTCDYYTLDLLDENEDGVKISPFDRKPFKMEDLKPNRDLYNKIKMEISVELKARKAAIGKICVAAQKGDVKSLIELLNSNKKIKVNDAYAEGYTALHYACQHQQLDSAKYLVEAGAELDAISKDNKTPLSILNNKSRKMAQSLLQHNLNIIKKGMVAGDAVSYTKCAKLLLNGRVVAKDLNKAIELFDMAGDLGDVNGYILCGDACVNETPASKWHVLAFKQYSKAAIKFGNLTAKIKRAVIFLTDNDNVKFGDLDISVHEISSLANAFDPKAQFLYSLLFKSGVGVGTSFITTVQDLKYLSVNYIKYLSLAAGQGLGIAQYSYAMCSKDGNWVEKDLIAAAKLFKMAADQGLVQAQFMCAQCFMSGYGVEKNLVAAAQYFKMAAAQGSAEAAQWLHELERAALEANRPVEQQLVKQEPAITLGHGWVKKLILAVLGLLAVGIAYRTNANKINDDVIPSGGLLNQARRSIFGPSAYELEQARLQHEAELARYTLLAASLGAGAILYAANRFRNLPLDGVTKSQVESLRLKYKA
jgi:TPR repeat protein